VYLSKLKIYGFKSFAQKVEVSFPGNGITSVVGPNGCGKSNIVDAIRWVLGEQRAKQLRSVKMEDVIFSGTAERPAMNFAEVSLVINNDRGILPSDYTEIQITRRVHRSGDSEYLINNQDCRLKDIHALFMDTGMGAASYSLMESRMIDSILSDKAEDRRVLFEETAGISKYKQQRKETLRQLERTSLDLERVEDNLKVRKSSVASYERQAKKAEDYRMFKARLRDLDISVGYDKYTEFKDGFKKLLEMSKEADTQLESFRSKKTVLETNLEEKKLNSVEEEEAYRDAEQQVANRKLELNSVDAEIRLIRDRIQHVEDSSSRSVREIEDGRDQLEDIKHRRVEKRENLTLLEQTIEEFLIDVEKYQDKKDSFLDRFEESREKVNVLSSRRMEQLEILGDVKSEAQQVRQKIEYHQQNAQSGNQELSTLTSEIDRLKNEKREFDNSSNEFEEGINLKQEELDVLLGRIELNKDELQEVKTQYDSLKDQFLKKQNRHDALSQLEEQGEGLDEGVKHIQDSFQHEVLGFLSDQLTIEPEYLTLVEWCLGQSGQSLVTKDFESGQNWIESFKNSSRGEVEFVVTNQSKEMKPSNYPEGESIFGPLSNHVSVDPSVKSIVSHLLGSYILVENLATAIECAKINEELLWFVTPDRTMIHSSGIVKTASSQNSAGGFIARRQELEQLNSELPGLSSHIENLWAGLSELEELREELTIVVQDLKDDVSEMGRTLSQSTQAKAVTEARLSDQESRLEKLLEKLSEASEDTSPLQDKLEELDLRIETIESSKEGVEEQFQDAQEELRELEHQKSAFDEEYNQSIQDLARQKSTKNQLETELSHLDQQEETISDRIEKMKLQIASTDDTMNSSLEKLNDLHNQLEIENEKLTQDEDRRDRAKELYDLKNVEAEEIREQIRNINTDIIELTENMGNSQKNFEAFKVKMDQIHNRIFEEYEVDFEEDQVKIIEYEESTVRGEISELKKNIKALGNINPAALEDFEDEKRLLQETEKQFEDLDRARISLEKTIRKLDQIARDRFTTTFAIIQKNFQDVFASLMRDGEARVTLEEGVDPLEAKIEINARPTGKKMRGVSLLSGGERALTATALLFGLYLIKPSPYCILDEVDGPLDDANIGRFVQLLRRFSKQTQFIVVTHNKRTMAASDQLYGVTQEIKGISRIASVQLSEAEGLID
tara:strand:+ start:859 stop:4407 length:3549 start_codon:yes stop_codon:yes gene_type:complete